MKKVIRDRATEKKVSNLFVKSETPVVNQSLKKTIRENTGDQRIIKSTVGKKKFKVGK